MKGRERPCSIRRRLRSSQNVLQRSVELASETMARSLGLITIVCTVLYSIPPTSILGAILLTGYLGGAMASHVRIGSPLFTHTLFGLYLGLMMWGGLWLRDKNLQSMIPFRR